MNSSLNNLAIFSLSTSFLKFTTSYQNFKTRQHVKLFSTLGALIFKSCDQVKIPLSMRFCTFASSPFPCVAIFVTTVALGLQPRQRHGKVGVEILTQESHLHFRECEWKCEGMNSHTRKWTPTLGVRKGLHNKLWASKVPEVLISRILGLSTQEPRKNDFWMQPLWLIIENTIMKEVVGFLKFGPWWVLWIHACAWLIHAPTMH